jgi:hypothetical protein
MLKRRVESYGPIAPTELPCIPARECEASDAARAYTKAQGQVHRSMKRSADSIVETISMEEFADAVRTFEKASAVKVVKAEPSSETPHINTTANKRQKVNPKAKQPKITPVFRLIAEACSSKLVETADAEAVNVAQNKDINDDHLVSTDELFLHHIDGVANLYDSRHGRRRS